MGNKHSSAGDPPCNVDNSEANLHTCDNINDPNYNMWTCTMQDFLKGALGDHNPFKNTLSHWLIILYSTILTSGIIVLIIWANRKLSFLRDPEINVNANLLSINIFITLKRLFILYILLWWINIVFIFVSWQID